MTAVAAAPVTLPTTAPSSVAPTPANDSKSDTAEDKPSSKPNSKKESKEDTKREKISSEEAKDGPTPPDTSGTRSMFDLEPNPFEQSFSKTSDRTTPPRGGDATSVKHNALPPLSSLTSPAANGQFPWLAGHSLRSGPLSPAMLAGPAQGSQQTGANAPAQPAANAPTAAATWGGAGEGNSADQENFEPGNFRTGFTPGTGTGFTPGYNALLNPSTFGGPLPMPSPNTAAFLNSITNVAENADGANANANAAAAGATGAFSNAENRQPPSAIPPHLQQHGPVAPPLNPGTASSVFPPDALGALAGAVGNDINRGGPQGAIQQQPYYPPGMHPGGPGLAPGMPQVDFAQQNANAASQAANGLFLLSQAHQELSKREREEAQSSPVSGKRGAAGAAKATAGQKRKDAPPKGGAAKKSKKKEEILSDSEDEEMSEEKKLGRPETEEEKRRNFLERNRQAALKCRQRKKAWLSELQTKVETLSVDNERLQHTVRTLEDECNRLNSILMQHRDCGLAMPPNAVPPAYGRALR